MFSHSLTRSVGRGIIAMCAAVILTSAHTAQAGINIWTTQGPTGGFVRAFAIDPLTPTTLYAGTEGGVFKSTNSGSTWSPASSGLTGFNSTILALGIDPLTPSTLYAGTSGGVFKSTDAGGTWSPASSGPMNPSACALRHRSTHAQHALRRDVRRRRVQEHGRRQYLESCQHRPDQLVCLCPRH